MPVIHKLTEGQELFAPSYAPSCGAATVDLILVVTMVSRKWATVHVKGSVIVGKIDTTAKIMEVRLNNGSTWREVFVSKKAYKDVIALRKGWREFARSVGLTMAIPPEGVTFADIDQARAILNLRKPQTVTTVTSNAGKVLSISKVKLYEKTPVKLPKKDHPLVTARKREQG